MKSSVADPDSSNPDPVFQVNPDPGSGFYKKNTLQVEKIIFFDQKLQFTYP